MAGTIIFGNARAEYTRGEPEDWQKPVSLRQRPDQEGADVVRFANAPIRFVMPAVLFGTTTAQIRTMRQRWAAAQGEVYTLYLEDPTAAMFTGTTLINAHNVTGIKPLLVATNSANWEMWIALVFARVQAT